MPTKSNPRKNILPCPFCKSTTWAFTQTSDEKTFNIICLSCYACGPDAESKAKAKELWNNRDSENPFAKKVKWNKGVDW